jgi:hypothetical protein
MDTQLKLPGNSRPEAAPNPKGKVAKRIVLITTLIVAFSCYVILERLHYGQHLSASTAAGEMLAQQPLVKIKEALDGRNFHNTTELLDCVMGLANRHTIHLIDAWHDRNWDNQDLVLAHVYQAMLGDETARPHSSCGPRCMIMAWILQSYDIQSRQIGIFSSVYPERIVGHQQIEILNPDSGKWELYDPTWNVHFVDEKSGERLSAVDVYFRPAKPADDGRSLVEGIVPSNHDGTVKGWDALYPLTREQRIPISNFADFGAVMYYCFQTRCPNEILVNAKRFDIDKTWAYPTLGLTRATFETYCRKVYPQHSMQILEGPPGGSLLERLEHPALVPTY